MVVVDASVCLRWFVEQKGHEEATERLRRFIADPDELVGPDLLRFELFGGLCRLQPRRDPTWAARSFDRFVRLGVRSLPTTRDLFERAAELSRTLKIAGYDAIYLAHAEDLSIPWLTADEKALRRLRRDPRVQSLVA
jgi:predicted nucleic acid-binding protein